MRVSIVIPALNEAAGIAAALAPLQVLRERGHEVIVVDGGSSDGTLALASPLADRTLAAPRGRAIQMNAGAAVASGEVLLFLHADSHLTDGGVDALIDGLGRSGRRWGRFDITIEGGARLLPVIAAMMNVRSRITGVATGDQGMFVTRALFDAVGGFPLQPLMEDVELSRRLKRAGGKPLCLRHRLVTSGRRWDERGVMRTIALMWRLRFAYWRGAGPAHLAARYAVNTGDRAARLPTLQIFAKAPVPGAVKTRLAAAIGVDGAAAIHVRLTERTLRTAAAARRAGIVGRVELWCAPDTGHPAFAEWQARHGVALHAQQGADLGARMRHALSAALAQGTPVMLIGTDCPALEVSHLARAAAALIDHDAVFGPAEDGGYVLVGLAREVDAFDDIPWGTSGVMAATRSRLRDRNVRWTELPPLWDVDVAADLARWNRGDRDAPARSPVLSEAKPG